jgi:tRNA C32,U32 (ribose-2'-O)-methylase TrmJ
LFREETLLLTHLVRIPMPAETLSLNLSHAVAIGLYAFMGEGESPSVQDSAGALATRSEDAATLDLLFARLEAGGFFKGGKQEAQRDYVRLLWQRLRPDRRELDFLAGILKSLAR